MLMKAIRNKGLIVTIATVGIPMLIQLYYIRYISYNVSEDLYGRYVLLLTLAAAMSSILLTIPSAAFVRYFNETKDKGRFVNEFRTVLIPINIISLVFMLLYYSVMPQFDLYVVLMMYLYVVFQNNTSLNKQIVLQGLRRNNYFVISLVEKSSKYLFPLLIFYLYPSLDSLVGGLLVGVMVLTLIVYAYNRRYQFYFVFRWRRVKLYLKYAYPILFTSVFSWVIVFSDRYYIEYFVGSSYVGIYSLMAQVAAFSSVFNAIFSMYVNPIIYKKHSDDASASFNSLLQYIKILGGVIVVAMALVVSLPRNIFEVLLSPDVVNNDDYYMVLIILILSSVLSVFQNSFSLFFTLSKRLDVLAMIWFIAAVFNLAGNYYVKYYGVFAAAASTCASYLLVVMLNFYWIKRKAYV